MSVESLIKRIELVLAYGEPSGLDNLLSDCCEVLERFRWRDPKKELPPGKGMYIVRSTRWRKPVTHYYDGVGWLDLISDEMITAWMPLPEVSHEP